MTADETTGVSIPSVDEIRANRARIAPWVVRTSLRRVHDDALDRATRGVAEIWLKEELFQRTGSFNHGISLGYSARALGTAAKIVMPRTANPFRVQLCRELGADVELVEDVHVAFEGVREIERTGGRLFVHPFEGPKTALGTASVVLEIVDQAREAGAPSIDAVLVGITPPHPAGPRQGTVGSVRPRLAAPGPAVPGRR